MHYNLWFIVIRVLPSSAQCTRLSSWALESTPCSVLPPVDLPAPFLELKPPAGRGRRLKEGAGEVEGLVLAPSFWLVQTWVSGAEAEEAGERKLLFIFPTMGRGERMARNCFSPIPAARSPDSNFS